MVSFVAINTNTLLFGHSLVAINTLSFLRTCSRNMKHPWQHDGKKQGSYNVRIQLASLGYAHLQGVEDGEEPGKDGGVPVDCQQPKRPRQPQ